ncbi:hypothetical protein [Fretibacter rubidus]|uniref:hypothetical protein n=1 Tax=Fretibacter rubidus TaxID=570162 RepID=UPI00352AC79D
MTPIVDEAELKCRIEMLSETLLTVCIAFLTVVFTLLGNAVLQTWRDKKETSDNDQNYRATLTALFSVRNFIVNQVNFLENHDLYHEVAIVSSLNEAQKTIEYCIDRCKVDSQHFMYSLYEVKLALVSYCNFIENYDALGDMIEEYALRRDSLLNSLEDFDFLTSSSGLTISENEIEQLLNFSEL